MKVRGGDDAPRDQIRFMREVCMQQRQSEPKSACMVSMMLWVK